MCSSSLVPWNLLLLVRGMVVCEYHGLFLGSLSSPSKAPAVSHGAEGLYGCSLTVSSKSKSLPTLNLLQSQPPSPMGPCVSLPGSDFLSYPLSNGWLRCCFSQGLFLDSALPSTLLTLHHHCGLVVSPRFAPCVMSSQRDTDVTSYSPPPYGTVPSSPSEFTASLH